MKVLVMNYGTDGKTFGESFHSLLVIESHRLVMMALHYSGCSSTLCIDVFKADICLSLLFAK